MDNIHLRNELARRRKMDPEIINHWFKWGLVLLALGMLYQELRKDGEEENDKDDNIGNGKSLYERISIASEGIAVTLIPVILQLGDGHKPR